MEKLRQNNRKNKAKKLQSNSNKPTRLKNENEVISQISSLHVRLLKSNLTNIKTLQAKENVSINFLLNEIVMDFFNNEKRRSPLMTH